MRGQRPLLDVRAKKLWTPHAPEWWRMPLIGVLVGGPISLTASLFLASYGADGPYGGFWRLLFAGLAASVPIFGVGGFLFAPLEIWLTRRPHRLRMRDAVLVRSGALSLAGVTGALFAHQIVVWFLAAYPPPTLFPVLLVSYPFIGAIMGLSYTFYDEYIRQLRVSTQLTQELRLARSIQQSLFPRQCPDVQGYALAAHCESAQETGGDFFDFMELRDGRLGMVIGDVAGKGMPAALLMADTRSIWRAEARLGDGPADTLRRVNRTVWRDVNANSFVTCLYAVLDPAAHVLHLAGAGHPLPLLHHNSGLKELEVYGLPLGLEPEASYDEIRLSLFPGDTLLLYTDGVVEAMNLTRELFGLNRLMALMQREGHRAPGALVERAWQVARAFSGAAGQADDMTVMVLKHQS